MDNTAALLVLEDVVVVPAVELVVELVDVVLVELDVVLVELVVLEVVNTGAGVV